MRGGGGDLWRRRGPHMQRLEAAVRAPAAVELATATRGIDGSRREAMPPSVVEPPHARAAPHLVVAVAEHMGRQRRVAIGTAEP